MAALIIMEEALRHESFAFTQLLARACVGILPIVVLASGLLMVSHFRYPHLVNRYLRGRRSIGRLLAVLSIMLLLLVAHQYTVGLGTLAYAAWGPVAWSIVRLRRWNRPLPA